MVADGSEPVVKTPVAGARESQDSYASAKGVFIVNNGWVKIHRRFKDKGYYKNSAYVHLWLHLLLSVNHDPVEYMTNGKILNINPGQILTGRKILSYETGIPETTIERVLKVFENEHQIGQQKTTKYRLITILNWEKYQKVDSKTDSKRTTNGQQADTNKNVKKDKNEKKDTASQDDALIPVIINLFKGVNPNHERLFGIPPQRKAVSRLLEKFGIEKLSAMISYLPKSNASKYAPTITTPVQFEQKLGELIAWSQKQKDIKKANVAFA